ncbi:glycosyltransferase [Turicibacter sanguinis]|uniref:glycosyltransferase n=1 Tax=Turicibacter sanguinis TaxID=154288 RepID=UPI00189995A8
MNKKKLLFVIPHLKGGGAEKVLIDILKQFDYSKYEVDLLLFYNEGAFLNLLPSEVNKKYLFDIWKSRGKVPNKLKKIFITTIRNFGMKYLYKALITKNYDVEIAFLEGTATKFVAASSNKTSKKIAWVHTDLENNHWTKPFYKNLTEEVNCYNKFNKIICVSEETKINFIKRFGRFDNIEVIYNPLDIENISYLGNQKIEKKFGFTITAVGRLEPQKGFDRLIKSIKKLHNENINCYLQIIGEGSNEKKLQDLVKLYSLEKYIEFIGFCENPYKYMKTNDLFVCSSRSEGFSLVVAEALILEKPIISTKCAGPVEILKNGKYGMIVDNSTDGLTNGIKTLYYDEKKRNFYSEKAHERIMFFDSKEKMKKIYNIIESGV